MLRKCKCHGVCGTCSMKTCWRRLPPIRQIGKKLKEKFNGASLVKMVTTGARRNLVPKYTYFKPATTTDLVYLDSSPDFCSPDKASGSLGTSGRVCKRSSQAIDGCDLLCCGRGYTTKTVVIEEKCQCKFNWCCFVQCKKCTKEVEVSRCRWHHDDTMTTPWRPKAPNNFQKHSLGKMCSLENRELCFFLGWCDQVYK